jgi:hypothetical protein
MLNDTDAASAATALATFKNKNYPLDQRITEMKNTTHMENE